jgi:hypothetical protein
VAYGDISGELLSKADFLRVPIAVLIGQWCGLYLCAYMQQHQRFLPCPVLFTFLFPHMGMLLVFMQSLLQVMRGSA